MAVVSQPSTISVILFSSGITGAPLNNSITSIYIQVTIFHPRSHTFTYCELRYIFEEKENKQKDSKSSKGKDAKDSKATSRQIIARLQECGPRFTLKLKSLQHGTFDTKGGEYEWVHKVRFFCSDRSGLLHLF